jgi:beta-fructofuranosidase
VVLLSLWRHVVGTHALSGVRYLVGDLVPSGEGLRFVAESGGTVDAGPTFYAPQVLVEPDRVLLWGWAWEGAQRTPEEIKAAGWAGTLTFPRELGLSDGVLQSRPARELTGLRGKELTLGPDGVVGASAFEIETCGPLQLILVDEQAGTRQPAAALPGPGRILVDGSIVEVFGSGPSLTARHYPTATSHWVVESASPYRVWPLA